VHINYIELIDLLKANFFIGDEGARIAGAREPNDWRQNASLFQDKALAAARLDSAEAMLKEKLAHKWQGLRESFLSADTDRNGYLDRAEFAEMLNDFGMKLSEEDVSLLMCKYDVSMDNKLGYKEFANGVGLFKSPLPKQRVAAWKSGVLQLKGGKIQRDIFTPPHIRTLHAQSIEQSTRTSGAQLAAANRRGPYQATAVTPPWALSPRSKQPKACLIPLPPKQLGHMATAK
jgi:hypothetical protein